jgi:hypothetical protein
MILFGLGEDTNGALLESGARESVCGSQPSSIAGGDVITPRGTGRTCFRSMSRVAAVTPAVGVKPTITANKAIEVEFRVVEVTQVGA